MKYAVILEPQPEGGFTAVFPDLRWGITQGETVSECLELAADAILTVLGDLIRQGQPIPPPKPRRGANVHMVDIPSAAAVKIALYQELRRQAVRKADLARRSGIPKQHVERLFDLRRATRGDLIDRAFLALGKRLAFAIRDAS